MAAATVAAWLGWPLAWLALAEGRLPTGELAPFLVTAAIGSPLAAPVGGVAWGVMRALLRRGRANVRGALAGGAGVGSLVAAITWVLGPGLAGVVSAVLVGTGAGALWWLALPRETRAALGARAP